MTDHSDYFKYNYDIIKEMTQVPMLKSFEEKDLQKLLRLSKIKEYKPGDLIFEEGSYDGCIYYLVYGKAKIVKNEKVLSVLQRTGEIFGEMGALDGSARSASVYAADNTMCLAIKISDVDGLSASDQFESRYKMYRGFAEILAHRLRVTTEELVRTKEELDKQNLVNRLILKTEELSKAKEKIALLQSRLRGQKRINTV
ncbi:Crp/Fnr family transcriptional regulator [Desulfonema magnum]|uniref:Cyclic nucleotide-binding domain-containing protein n=1 Tax=Desulfonema magnum TaxID=45655 RepID=A0A975BHN1_9BACT|nr:cyclic nucleotide-binding domain-containing protein [Desulfonema magnum]QTA85536.1 Cyclic nucleotide-binding domain-containing protein [Desulfonema magnum]